MSKQDIIIVLLIGFLVGFLLNIIALNIELKIPYLFTAPFVLALFALVALFIASLLGGLAPVLFLFAKFGAVGTLNTMADLGILNLLILFTGIAQGVPFSIFKGISFAFSVVNSYFWNKFWTFQSKESVQAFEFAKFATIATIGFFLNVGIASFVVNVVGPQFGIQPKVWANVGAIIAILIVMLWNFTGYKFLVFRSSKI